MKKLILFLLLLASPAFAADHYFNMDCSAGNNGDGTSLACADSPGGAGAWNAYPESTCNSSSFTWVRGDTYYFAGSDTSYGYVCISHSSGTGTIYIKKVTSAQSGVTGYNATHASKQALLLGLQIYPNSATSNIDFDGVTGSGKSGHGFKIKNTSSPISVPAGTARTGLAFRHAELTNEPDTLEGCKAAGTCDISIGLYNCSEVTIEDVYVHHSMGAVIMNGASDITIDGLYAEYNDSTAAQHSNGLSVHYSSNITVKNSYFRDIEGTAILSSLSGNADSWTIFNNVFMWSDDNPESRSGTGHGVFTTNNFASNASNFSFYSNTIIGTNPGLYSFVYLRGGASGAANIKNNLWYCNTEDCKTAVTAYPASIVLHFSPGSSTAYPTAESIGETVTCDSGSGTIGCTGTGCESVGVIAGDNVGAVQIINTSGTFSAGDYCTTSDDKDWTTTYVADPSLYSISNNYYYGNTYNASESNIQAPGVDETPFTNYSTGDFSLSGDSSAVNTGADLGASYNLDRVGTSRPIDTYWDIGAYEYQGGGEPPAPGGPSSFTGGGAGRVTGGGSSSILGSP